MAVTRLRDVPGAFTVVDLHSRYGGYYDYIYARLRRRAQSGELERHLVDGINDRGEHRQILVYRIPKAITVSWADIDKVLDLRCPNGSHNAKLPFRKKPTSLKEYMTIWGTNHTTTAQRLNRLTKNGILKVAEGEGVRGAAYKYIPKEIHGPSRKSC